MERRTRRDVGTAHRSRDFTRRYTPTHEKISVTGPVYLPDDATQTLVGSKHNQGRRGS